MQGNLSFLFLISGSFPQDYGVRANLKSEALIDLLLETQYAFFHGPSLLCPHLFSRSPPAPKPVQRAVSSRLPSKAGPSRVSSMVVHDISGDEDNSNEDQPPPEPVAPVRTRKAKELQKRLGVGKPVIAGGQGPRAVTRSSGSSRSRQTKFSRSRTVLESTIEEGAIHLTAIYEPHSPFLRTRNSNCYCERSVSRHRHGHHTTVLN